MPRRYKAMRDEFLADGLTTREAKRKAARIFNATRKRGEAPVTGYHPTRKRKRRARRPLGGQRTAKECSRVLL